MHTVRRELCRAAFPGPSLQNSNLRVPTKATQFQAWQLVLFSPLKDGLLLCPLELMIIGLYCTHS